VVVVVTVKVVEYTAAVGLVVGSDPSSVYLVVSTPEPPALSVAESAMVTGLVPNQLAHPSALHPIVVVGAVVSVLIANDQV
jgi:hypothetical protein